MLEEPEPTPEKETVGKLDSRTTSHFINKDFPGKTIEHKPMTVGWANTTTMESIATKEIELKLPLSKTMDDIDDNLISIKQLCDDDRTCLLQKTKAIIQCGDTTLICDRNGQLWDIPISGNTCKNKKGVENSITQMIKSDTGLAKYANTGLTQRQLKQSANPKIEKQPITQEANNAY